jgi:hypothetical protein
MADIWSSPWVSSPSSSEREHEPCASPSPDPRASSEATSASNSPATATRSWPPRAIRPRSPRWGTSPESNSPAATSRTPSSWPGGARGMRRTGPCGLGLGRKWPRHAPRRHRRIRPPVPGRDRRRDPDRRVHQFHRRLRRDVRIEPGRRGPPPRRFLRCHQGRHRSLSAGLRARRWRQRPHRAPRVHLRRARRGRGPRPTRRPVPGSLVRAVVAARMSVWSSTTGPSSCMQDLSKVYAGPAHAPIASPSLHYALCSRWVSWEEIAVHRFRAGGQAPATRPGRPRLRRVAVPVRRVQDPRGFRPRLRERGSPPGTPPLGALPDLIAPPTSPGTRPGGTRLARRPPLGRSRGGMDRGAAVRGRPPAVHRGAGAGCPSSPPRRRPPPSRESSPWRSSRWSTPASVPPAVVDLAPGWAGPPTCSSPRSFARGTDRSGIRLPISLGSLWICHRAVPGSVRPTIPGPALEVRSPRPHGLGGGAGRDRGRSGQARWARMERLAGPVPGGHHHPGGLLPGPEGPRSVPAAARLPPRPRRSRLFFASFPAPWSSGIAAGFCLALLAALAAQGAILALFTFGSAFGRQSRSIYSK